MSKVLNWDKVKELLTLEDVLDGDGLCSAIHKVRGEENCSEYICGACREWLTQPYNPKNILTFKEKEYLKGVIKPFRDKVTAIKKAPVIENYEYISIRLGDDVVNLPNFKKDEMYKGMRINYEYSLEELEL